MSILARRLKAAFQSFQDYRARQKAARTLAELDDDVLKDIGINARFPYTVIDTLRRR